LSCSKKKNDEVKQEQADSSNVIISNDSPKKLSLNPSHSDVIDSNEAEAKEIDINEVQPNEADSVDIIPFHTNEIQNDYNASNQKNTKEFEKDKIVASGDNTNSKILTGKVENTEIKELKSLDILDNKVNAKEESIENNEDLKEENVTNDNIIFKVKKIEVTPESRDDEDNIQDEELDHEVDEEEIKGSVDFNITNDTVSLRLNMFFIKLLNFNFNLGKIYSRK